MYPSARSFVTRPPLAHYTGDRAELERVSTRCSAPLKNGELHIRIGGEFPLENAADAHRALEGRKTTGKLLLTV